MDAFEWAVGVMKNGESEEILYPVPKCMKAPIAPWMSSAFLEEAAPLALSVDFPLQTYRSAFNDNLRPLAEVDATTFGSTQLIFSPKEIILGAWESAAENATLHVIFRSTPYQIPFCPSC